ncbi:MAG: TetR family transcriptional regulator [Micavibrio sp.]|nr:TetR family transcriptional regulator [Micavibrio sp.]
MSKKTKENLKDHIAIIAMALSGEIGWAHVSMAEIAEKAGLTLAELYDVVDDRSDILTLVGRLIDRKVLENMEGALDNETPARDRLFDIMMERFDVLNEYRGGILTVLESFHYDPKQAVISCPHLCRSMSWMLEAAGIEVSGIKGAMKVAGLTALYIKTLRVWRSDESVDMAKVMAALDKDLGRVEGLALRFGL